MKINELKLEAEKFEQNIKDQNISISELNQKNNELTKNIKNLHID